MDAGAALADYCANRERYRETIDNLILLKAQRQPIANETLCLQHLKHWPEPSQCHSAAGDVSKRRSDPMVACILAEESDVPNLPRTPLSWGSRTHWGS